MGAALELGLRKSIFFYCVSFTQAADLLRILLPFVFSFLTSIFAANYEEYLGKCVMINVPWIFTAFWYFVKGFLDEK